MTSSDDRILTTHVGSLPRPEQLTAMMIQHAEGTADEAALARLIDQDVDDVVARQVKVGIDLVNDGEFGRTGFCSYLSDRVDGISGQGDSWAMRDLVEVPGMLDFVFSGDVPPTALMPACEGELHYHGQDAAAKDAERLQSAAGKHGAIGGFMTAPSPGCIATHMSNRHYADYESYLFALAEELRHEYKVVIDSGLSLQLDAPDIPVIAHTNTWMSDVIDDLGYDRYLDMQIEALNVATADLPADRLRLHLCWGNYEGPHHHDIPLEAVLRPVLQKARPGAVTFEAANPRHEHEWNVFERLTLPDDKVIIPGVIDSTTNFVEHPELVAQRIERFASLVGRERVIAGTDCGFGTFVGFGSVFGEVVWLKLQSLAEGARIASERLWSGTPAPAASRREGE